MSFGVGAALSTTFGSNGTINSSKKMKENVQPAHEDPEIKKSFQKIAALKYDVRKCNCKHKSNAFADLLAKKGAKNIYLIAIEHKFGEYSHMVVSWEDKVHDTTITPPVYGIEEGKYLNELKKYGFTGLQVKTSYPSNI
jgi:hypothetical protein